MSLKEWKRLALQRLDHWDELESERPLSLEEIEEKHEAAEEYKRWALFEEIS